MPLTPLHYPIAYFINKIDTRFSLPGLIVGCMFPDLEIPFMLLIFGTNGPNRMILHSFLGSATIGTVLSLFFTVWFYPFFVSDLFRIKKEEIEKRCKFSFVLFFSVFVGNISHVLLDVLNHPYNPILWPFFSATSTPSPFFFAFEDPFGYFWIQLILGTLLIGLIFLKRKNLFQDLLVS